MEPEVQSPEVKGTVAFGTKAAIAGPTPKAIKLFYRTLMILSTIWAVVVEPIFTDIPLPLSHHIDQFLIALNTLVYQLCQQFGWVAPRNATTEV